MAQPRPSVRFVYLGCTDLEAMRRFYSDLLDLNEIYHAPGPEGAVAYDCDGLQFTILANPGAEPGSGWARQPGWQGGTAARASWSVEVPAARYGEIVDRLLAADVPRYYDRPRWHGYWGFPVKDPMGNTVELTLPTDEEPAIKVWGEGPADPTG